MKLLFKTTKPAVRAAGSLRKLLAQYGPLPTDLHFKNTTAKVFGHESWESLAQSCCPEANLSPYDEECTLDEFTERRQFQATVLEAVCHSVGLLVDGQKVVADWRPSANYPRVPTEFFFDAAALSAAGRPNRCLFLLAELDLRGRFPLIEELDYIVNTYPCCSKEELDDIEALAGTLAVRMVNRQSGEIAEQGVRILEGLVANGCEYPRVLLAQASRNGWGIAEDHKRARSLLDSVLEKVDRGEVTWTEKSSYIALYSQAAFLWLHAKGIAQDAVKAFELYRRAAAEGDGPSALYLSWFLAPLREDQEPDAYTGVVEPNLELAKEYYVLAVDRGYNLQTKQFDQVEVA